MYLRNIEILEKIKFFTSIGQYSISMEDFAFLSWVWISNFDFSEIVLESFQNNFRIPDFWISIQKITKRLKKKSKKEELSFVSFTHWFTTFF